MAWLRRLAAAGGLLLALCAMLPPPAYADPAPKPADLSRLRAAMDQATRVSNAAYAQINQASARMLQLRVERERLAHDRDLMQTAFDERVRAVYMAGSPDPIEAMMAGLEDPTMTAARKGVIAGFSDADSLLSDLSARSADMQRLERKADHVHADLARQAEAVYAAHDKVRTLLAAAEVAYAKDEAVKAELARRRERLQWESTQISFSVAPAVTERGRRAAAAEAPIVALVESSGSGIPVGFHRTGQSLSGVSSWYGPGFVGNPTATGAPYDPERLTAAMLAVPLGTVVHVSRPDGRAINVLVNDRGPYVDGRILDLSRAGSRLLGFSGLAEVTVEVLARD